MILNLILIIVLVICFITDLKYRKIYNKVIFPALIAAVMLNLLFYGYDGLKLSITGLVLGSAILLIPYLLGGIGAGDVKLLGLIGALKGSIFVLNTALYMAVIGGVMAVIIILCQKESAKIFKGMILWAASFFNGIKYRLQIPTSSLLRKYPYGLAIAAGAVICLVFRGAWIV